MILAKSSSWNTATSAGSSEVRVALAGNPNCGKTSLFNALTGTRQKVGNYPGVTVEKKEGRASIDKRSLHLVDLPGTYSLTPYSADEVVARNELIDEHPDVVVNIVDASNLSRHLYLTTQLLELGLPVVLVLNMMDIARHNGVHVDVAMLSDLLGVPVVETVASKGEGLDELKRQILAVADDPQAADRMHSPTYGQEIEPHVAELTAAVGQVPALTNRARWFAIKLLENDDQTHQRIARWAPGYADTLTDKAAHVCKHLESIYAEPTEILLADRRYGYIAGALAETVHQTGPKRRDVSDRIDHIVTHRLLGLPIFALAMYLVFQLTFWIGTPLVDLLDTAIHGHLVEWIGQLWPAGDDSLLRSLLVDGVIGGVGAVIVFIPLIVLMFLGIAFLEDSGYMARAAFVMDAVMHRMGLHGKSFVPMLIGFGCSVPAILATRTLKSRRDRLTTILVLPLMSCGARLPIYLLIVPAFFPPRLHTPILWSIYVIGILIAVGMARLFRATIFRGESEAFVMELPPYRMPTVRGLLLHMWERTWMYVRKAGTIILAGAVLLWVVTTFPQRTQFTQDYASQIETLRAEAAQLSEAAPQAEQLAEQIHALSSAQRSEEVEYTIAGRAGRAVEPVLRTMGFDWKIGTALFGAFAAKEIFVSQLGIVYAVGEDADEESEPLRQHLRNAYSPLVGFCICLFCLITMPCVATFAAAVRESGSWGWGLFMLGYLTVTAWGVTTLVYQVGRLIGA